MNNIYLDYNASTPIDPEVIESMKPYLTGYFGNPSTNHWAGKPLKEALDKARNQISSSLNCHPSEIDYFWSELKRYFKENVKLNGHPQQCLPNTLNISFVGKSGFEILNQIPQLAASTGSACHSESKHISPVLKAMNVNELAAMGTIRFSLGRYTTKEDIDLAIKLLVDHV